MDEMTMLRRARPVPAPPTAEALRTGRAQLIEATRQPARQVAAHGTLGRLRPGAVAAGTTALAGAALAAAVVVGAPSAPSRTVAGPRSGRIATMAWTVQVNQDRTVTITVRQLRDPAGLQRTLRREGIPAIVRYVPLVTETVGGRVVTGPACDYALPRPAFPPATWRAVIVSGPGPSSAASPAQPAPSSSARPGPARSASALPRPTASASPLPGAHLPAGVPLMVLTIRPRAMPRGAAVLIDDSIAKPGATASAFGVSLLASDHLPRCVPLRELPGHHN